MKNENLILKLISMLVDSDCGENTPEKSAAATESSGLSGRYIVIGNRGNIVVGDMTQSGDMCHMENASVIRRWGTTKGLGQLALEGPTSDTILDKCGSFDFHIQTTCGLIKVESDL